MHSFVDDEEIRHLQLCQDFCSCGNPDPWNEEHTENCPMSLDISIIEEVETISPTGPRKEYLIYEWKED